MGAIFYLINIIMTWEFFFPLAIILSAIILCINVWFGFKLINMLTQEIYMDILNVEIEENETASITQ